jgi:hypothetical protein
MPSCFTRNEHSGALREYEEVFLVCGRITAHARVSAHPRRAAEAGIGDAVK